jgi:hypothetical protein
VEGRRYADEPEPSWYSGQSPYEVQNPYDSGVHERPSGAFRLPEQRTADGYGLPAPDPMTSTGSHALPTHDPAGARIPIRGPEYRTVRPTGATSLADAPAPASSAPTVYGGPPASVPSNGPSAAAEPTAVVPPLPRFATGSGPDSVYRTRRHISAVMVAVVAALLMIPVILLLIQVTFVDVPAARGIVPAVLLTVGLPLAGGGLYSLAAGGGATGREAWLRPPIAYLPVGLLLLLAAGLAVA